MATDDDASAGADLDGGSVNSLELDPRRAQARSAMVDVEQTDTAESAQLPGADLSGEEEFSVRVVPKQANEFTCSTCFLVHHHSRYAGQRRGRAVCRDCAA